MASPELDGPVLIQGSLRTSLRSQRQASSLDVVLMANAQQGVLNPENMQEDTALVCLRDLLAEQSRSPAKSTLKSPLCKPGAFDLAKE
ncbi:hypothetical protein DIPPA_05999 [Diplonema papillatum]|nr:hypothetical protein DIPPA_05999 [Diplonema papillatum]